MQIGHNSQPIKEDDIHRVVDFLHKYPQLIENAKKKAARAEWLAEVLLAEIINRTEGKSYDARKAKAITEVMYRNAKEAEINAASEEMGVKAQFAANELIASLYQTQSANMRSTKV